MKKQHISLNLKVKIIVITIIMAIAVYINERCVASIEAVDKLTKPIEASEEHNTSLSTIITNSALKHNLERSTLSCILKIESGYRLNAESTTKDYGIGQINERTIKWLKLDKDKLLNNLEYSVDAAASHLNYLQQLLKPSYNRTWPCAYNVGVAGLIGRNKGYLCELYLSRLNECILSGKIE